MRCHGELECTILEKNLEIKDGFLFCNKCNLIYPIIDTVPILWDDFTNYLSNRPRLGGELLLLTRNPKMKSFIKNILAKAHKTANDLSIIEKRWAEIYKKNQKSKFYGMVQKALNFDSTLSLEHGCSIGMMTRHLAKNSDHSFGIDKSWYGICEAKNSRQKSLDFIVADSLEQPFGKTKFDTILALNLFEIIEPKDLVRLLAWQVQKNGTLVLSDPYDFERGVKSVKDPLYADTLRYELTKLGFAISQNTKKPSFHPWVLELYDRASLHYLVDFVLAKNIGKS